MSRNGWGGSARPKAASTSTNVDTFVDESRIDRRIHAGNWCNQSGAGLGERPRASPADGIDAYVWIKPPGESDGSSMAIANTDGVDGIFIGPADLSASLGYPGDQGNPAVVKAIEDAVRRIRACGKPSGILTANKAFAQHCIDIGTTFTAVGIDIERPMLMSWRGAARCVPSSACDGVERPFGTASKGA